MKLVLAALFVRPNRRRPVRFLLTALGVAAGVASVLATVAASRAAIASLREGTLELAGRSVLEITRPGRVEEGLLGRLRSIATFATLLPIVEEPVQVVKLREVVRLLGVDVFADRDARDVLGAALAMQDAGGSTTGPGSESVADLTTRGSRLILEEHAVMLPRPLARDLELSAGDTLNILVHAQERVLRVVHVFDVPRESVAFDRLMVTDVSIAQELTGRVGYLDRVEIAPRAKIDVAELKARIERLLPEGYRVGTAGARAEQTSSMLRALQFNLTALSGVSLFVGMVLVATTLATSVVQRRAWLALLVSLGASRRTIAAAIGVEALALGLLGGVLGVWLGQIGALLCVDSVRATVSSVVRGIPNARVEFDPWLASLGLLLGAITALAAATLPLIEALRVPPIQALRAAPRSFLTVRRWLQFTAATAGSFLLAWALARLPAWHDLPVAALASAFALMGAIACASAPAVDLCGRAAGWIESLRRLPVLRVALAALEAGRERASWAAGALGMACALAVSMTTMIESFRTSVSDWTRQTMGADLFIKAHSSAPSGPVGTLSDSVVEVLRELFGAAALDPFYSADAFHSDQRIELAGAAFAVSSLQQGGVPMRDGRPSPQVFAQARERHEMVINESLSRKLRMAEGDVLRLRVANGTREWRIAGVFLDYSSSHGLAVIDQDEFLAIYPDHGPWNIDVHLPPGADPEAARARLQQALRGPQSVAILLGHELREQVNRVFERTFAITRSLQLIAALVAVIAVFTVLGALVQEREKDLAVLTALGASSSQRLGVVLSQAGVIAVLGAVLGILVGLCIGRVLVEVVNVQSFGWTLRLRFPWAEIVRLLLAILAAGLAAGVPVALRSLRVPVGTVLREET